MWSNSNRLPCYLRLLLFCYLNLIGVNCSENKTLWLSKIRKIAKLNLMKIYSLTMKVTFNELILEVSPLFFCFFWGGLRDELVAPRMIGTLCILCNIRCSNSLQVYLQGACLNWCEVPRELNNVLQSLQLKAEQPSEPKSSYFGCIEQFIGISWWKT